jgi:hypothetical protein
MPRENYGTQRFRYGCNARGVYRTAKAASARGPHSIRPAKTRDRAIMTFAAKVFATKAFATRTCPSPSIGTVGSGPDRIRGLLRDAAPS